MSQLPEFPVQGGCACDRVRFRLTERPACVYTCHCTDCQTITTSAFVLGAFVRREAIEVTQGEMMMWERIHTTSGARPRQYSCKHCGVRIYSESDAHPEIRTLRAGTLDDTSWLMPAGAIWLKSKQPWVIIPEDQLRYDDGGDMKAIGKAWQAQWAQAQP